MYKPTRTQKNEKALIRRINYRLSVRKDAAQHFRLRKYRGKYLESSNNYCIEDTRTGRIIEDNMDGQMVHALDSGLMDFSKADLERAA